MRSRQDNRMKSLKSVLKNFDWDERKYISREFQDFGYRLAQQLGDLKHKALYIKLAKETPRHLLEEALRFVKEASQVKSPPRLFMWKLQKLLQTAQTEEKTDDK